MNDAALEQRALVLAPTGKDASLIHAALQRAGVVDQVCANAVDLADEARRGVGAVLLAEEAIVRGEDQRLLQVLIDEQPSWSDLPVVLLVKAGPPSQQLLATGRRLGNVTLLERPVPSSTLVSAVRTALRTRGRQYLTRTADQRKDAFLATLAHELRNPLAPMSNALHLIRRPDAKEEIRRWSLDVIERQLLQLTRLVDDLLDVARITQGKVALQTRTLDARDVIRNAVEASQPLIDTMHHVLHLRLPSHPVWVNADPVRLAQCVSNLLNNAAKYTPEGGRIELVAQVRDGELELSVTDNGVGIPLPAMQGLFEIFSQVDRSRPQAQGGLGIGLSLVKTFIEMHGGRVEARSDGDGHGSTFVARIPLAAGDADATATATLFAAEPVVTGTPQRILVVDDNIDNADSLSLLLDACGHTVAKAYTGQGGLDAAMAAPPDMAILDLGLPDINGFELASRLRAAPATSHTVLVALSGWGQAVDRQRSAQAGFAHHLVKPADPSAVLQLIQNAVRQPATG
ncbi:MAG TPA: hybrid sensor histidine kinase/response regulator [Albitalea sp.]|nr:hybrid sensor histidine kinase/response regulator [Albitalea sp.]